ncbi:MAG: hypothetical protein ICV67_01920 [Thermoleophilia bacterium]|nr:hypothetical protein [Thermoleophilia bacterium]
MLAVVASVILAAGAQTAALDRTFVCSPELRDLDVLASPRGDRAFATARFVSSGYLGLNTGSIGGRANLVYARARLERSDLANVTPMVPGVYAGAGRCFLSRKTVALTSRGLAGPPVVWAKDYTCTVRGRLVVRIRATVAEAGSWRRIDNRFFGVRTNVLQAILAVRSERTGEQVAYGTMDSAGRTKLWVAPGCG